MIRRWMCTSSLTHILILLLITVLPTQTTKEQHDTSYCERPQYPPPSPPIIAAIGSVCAATPVAPQSLSLPLLTDEAWRFAPKIHFHPLETYHLSNVSDYLEYASVYTKSHARLGPARLPDLLEYNSVDTDGLYISAQDQADEAYKYGSPFTADDQSTAQLYFRAYNTTSSRSSYVFTFTAFYAWNGCSNQEILQEQNNQQVLFQYIPCHLGEHEGDFEQVTVEVCHDLTTVVRYSLSQHGWNEQHNCVVDADECTLVNGTHPVTYSALNTHAFYSKPAFSHVYMQVYFDTLASVKAISLVDRTVRGERRYTPTPHNVVPMEVYALNGAADRHNVSTLFANGEPEAWLAYRGRWGRSYREPAEATEFTCLFRNQTRRGSCVGSPMMSIAQTLLGVSTSNFQCNLLWGGFADQVQRFLNTDGPTSPPYLTTEQFPNASVPPVFEDGRTVASIVCPDPRILVDTIDYTTTNDAFTPSFAMIMGFAAFCGAVLVSLLVLTAVARHVHRNDVPSLYAQLQTQSRCAGCANFADSIPKLNFFGLCIGLSGAVVFERSLEKTVVLLRNYISDSDFIVDEIEQFLGFIVPFVILVQLVYTGIAFFITGRAFEYFCLHKYSRCHHQMKYWGWAYVLVLLGLLVVTNVLVLAVFGFAIISFTVMLAFVSACDALDNAREYADICLNLEDLGLATTICGSDLANLCDSWRSFGNVDAPLLVIGAVLLSLSTVCFITTGGIHFYRLLIFKNDTPDYEETIIVRKRGGSDVGGGGGGTRRRRYSETRSSINNYDDWRTKDLRKPGDVSWVMRPPNMEHVDGGGVGTDAADGDAEAVHGVVPSLVNLGREPKKPSPSPPPPPPPPPPPSPSPLSTSLSLSVVAEKDGCGIELTTSERMERRLDLQWSRGGGGGGRPSKKRSRRSPTTSPKLSLPSMSGVNDK